MSVIYVVYTVVYGIDPIRKTERLVFALRQRWVMLCDVHALLSFGQCCLKLGSLRGDELIGRPSGLTHFLLNLG